MKIQVWMRDGYGQGSILKTLDTVNDALDFAKKHVSDTNFDNALTPQERRRNWEYTSWISLTAFGAPSTYLITFGDSLHFYPKFPEGFPHKLIKF